MKDAHLLFLAGLGITGGLCFLAMELGKTRATAEKLIDSPLVSAVTRLGGR